MCVCVCVCVCVSMQESEFRNVPKLFGNDGGIGQPATGTVAPVNLLNLKGSVRLGARAWWRVGLRRRLDGYGFERDVGIGRQRRLLRVGRLGVIGAPAKVVEREWLKGGKSMNLHFGTGKTGQHNNKGCTLFSLFFNDSVSVLSAEKQNKEKQKTETEQNRERERETESEVFVVCCWNVRRGTHI